MIPASLLRGIHLQALVHAAHHARLRPATGGPDGAGFDVHWRRRAARIANASRSGPPPYRNSGPAPHDSWSRRQASPQQLLTSSMASGTTASRGRAPAIMPRSGSRAPAPWLGCVVRAVNQVVGARSTRVALSAPAGGHGRRACLAKRRLDTHRSLTIERVALVRLYAGILRAAADAHRPTCRSTAA
jgi:hypothetical protein